MFNFYADLEMRAKYEASERYHCLDMIQYADQREGSNPVQRQLRHEDIVQWLDQEVQASHNVCVEHKTNSLVATGQSRGGEGSRLRED